jgi:hypothetical protein
MDGFYNMLNVNAQSKIWALVEVSVVSILKRQFYGSGG